MTVKDPPAHFPTRVKEVVAVIGLHYLQKIQDEEGTHVAIDDEPDFCIFLVGDTFHTRHLLPAGYVWSRVDDKINAWAIKFDGMVTEENLLLDELRAAISPWGYGVNVNMSEGYTRPLQPVTPLINGTTPAGSSAAHGALPVDPAAAPEPPATVQRPKRRRG